MNSPVGISVPDEAFADVKRAPRAVPASPSMTTTVSSLTMDLLTWIASKPRTYAETMEAWRSSCPRLTIWEDAYEDGLVCLESGSGAKLSETSVVLTSRGHAVVNS